MQQPNDIFCDDTISIYTYRYVEIANDIYITRSLIGSFKSDFIFLIFENRIPNDDIIMLSVRKYLPTYPRVLIYFYGIPNMSLL